MDEEEHGVQPEGGPEAPSDTPEEQPAGGQPENDGGKARRKVALWHKPAPCQGKKYSKSFQIALAGISCALAVVALIIGYYAQYIIASMFIVAEVALMVPLSKQFIKADILAYLGTVILAVVFGAVAKFWDLIPFIMFFGLHPVVNCLQQKYSVNRWLALIVKMVWFDTTLLVWFYAIGGLMGISNELLQTIYNYVWIIILVGGSLLLWLYDYIMFKVQIWINRLVDKIKK